MSDDRDIDERNYPEPGEVIEMPPDPRICSYWDDGMHCYEMMFKPEARELNRKTCACGHEVKPR